jgi:hypothetical protein
MSLKFIRLQKSDSLIRLRSNSKRSDLALFCEQDENASMPVVALRGSRCYRSSRARPQTQSHRGKSAVPVAPERRIERPGREDGSAARSKGVP